MALIARSFDFTGSGQGQSIEWQEHFWINDEPVARGLDRTLPPRLADLIDLAMAVYVADRVASRRGDEPDLHHVAWSRHFQLRVGVRDLAFWKRPDVGAQLDGLLEWLTDDVWELELAPRQAQSRMSELQQHVFSDQSQPVEAVALFSGGADSLAGALCHDGGAHSMEACR